jgi:hypothetical protein
MSVTLMPPSLYSKLLIVNPQERSKRVAFSDLNEIRTFRYREVPAQVSRRPIEEILQARIEYLERKIDRLTQDKENSTMAQINQYSSAPRSEVSVTSPHRPVKSPVPTPSTRAQNDATWKSRDVHLTHPPANVKRALTASPSATVKSSPRSSPKASPTNSFQEPSQLQVASVKKRFFAGIGALLIGPGTVAGLLSIVALGPVGLGVAAGAAALGVFLIWASNRMN